MNSLFKNIAHVSFGTKNLDRIIKFYQEVFSARVAHEFRNQNNELYGIFLQITPKCYLEFFNSAGSSGHAGSFRHFCLEVEDLNAVVAHLKSKGLNPEAQRSKSDKTLQCWIEDPDGNRIEFHHYDQHSALFKE